MKNWRRSENLALGRPVAHWDAYLNSPNGKRFSPCDCCATSWMRVETQSREQCPAAAVKPCRHPPRNSISPRSPSTGNPNSTARKSSRSTMGSTSSPRPRHHLVGPDRLRQDRHGHRLPPPGHQPRVHRPLRALPRLGPGVVRRRRRSLRGESHQALSRLRLPADRRGSATSKSNPSRWACSSRSCTNGTAVSPRLLTSNLGLRRLALLPEERITSPPRSSTGSPKAVTSSI